MSKINEVFKIVLNFFLLIILFQLLIPGSLINPNKTRHLSLLPAQTVSARQETRPGQMAQCRHRTGSSDPGLVNPEYFMEVSGSVHPLEDLE